MRCRSSIRRFTAAVTRLFTLIPSDAVRVADYEITATVRGVSEDHATADGALDTTQWLSAAAVTIDLAAVNTGTPVAATMDSLAGLLLPFARPYLVVTDSEWSSPRQIQLRFSSHTHPYEQDTYRAVQLAFVAPRGLWEAVEKGADRPIRLQGPYGVFTSKPETTRPFYERLFGPYPYERLTVAEIPLFPGGYGSTSLVMLTSASWDAKHMPHRFLAHEIAHQWWGNSVFPKGPGAGWLAEGFAEYSSYLWSEHAHGGKGGDGLADA